MACSVLDAVQRKLILIDKQLAGGRNFHKQIFTTSPLLFIATGLIIGILAQNALTISIWFWLILLMLCAVSAILLFTTQRADKLNSYALVFLSSCALICSACLGAVRLTSYYQPTQNDIRNFIGAERKLATIRGFVATEPHVRDNRGWQFVKFTHRDPASSFYLKINEVKTTTGWGKVTGTVRVQVAEPLLDLKVGDHIQAYCWLDRFKEPQNPGQFNVARYLARRGVFVAASVKSRDGIKLLKSGNPGVFARLQKKLQSIAAAALLGQADSDSQSQALLQALLLGTRRNIDSDTYDAFAETGLLHFISLSGLHVGILVGIIWWLCRLAGLLRVGRATVCIIATGLFVLIVPPRAPILRAAIICWVFCISFIFRRRSNPLNTLSLAAIILLLVRPTGLFEAGWQLSFATVLGILLFCRRTHFFLYEKITGLPWGKKASLTRPFFRMVSRPGPYLLRLFSTGVTAWLGGAGILLYHFYTINPLTAVWTVIVFPLVGVILVIGFLKIIFSLLLPTAGAALGIVLAGASDLLIGIVKAVANLNISQILLGSVPVALILSYYCFILFAGFAYFRKPITKKIICTVAIVALVAWLGTIKWQRTTRNDLAITCLSVGHGQAIFARLPGKNNILFDAGSVSINNCGRRVVLPFLNFNGTKEIDAIVLSHSDIDHINGIPEIVQHCRAGAVYANQGFFSKTNQPGPAKSLSKWLNKYSLGIRLSDQDVKVESPAKIKMLWPDEQICQSKNLGDNDKSQVILIEFAGRKILLCSDIERFAQEKLLQLYPNLKVDCLLVPHHGLARSLVPEFLENIAADILLFSCSQSQYEKQITKVDGKGKTFYTARDGAITVRVRKDGTIKLDSWRN